MSILCWMFGHRPPSDSWSAGGEYGRLFLTIVDGIGRQHGYVMGVCPRCGEKYNVVSVHLPKEKVNEKNNLEN